MSDDTAAAELHIPDGARVDSRPIEDGVCMLNGAVPVGHDDHEVWRTPTNEELRGREHRTRVFAVESERARWAMLRIERERRLRDTDWTELPSAAERLTDEERKQWGAYRQALRDLPAVTPDPDDPPWPAAPGEVEEAQATGAAVPDTIGL